MRIIQFPFTTIWQWWSFHILQPAPGNAACELIFGWPIGGFRFPNLVLPFLLPPPNVTLGIGNLFDVSLGSLGVPDYEQFPFDYSYGSLDPKHSSAQVDVVNGVATLTSATIKCSSFPEFAQITCSGTASGSTVQWNAGGTTLAPASVTWAFKETWYTDATGAAPPDPNVMLLADDEYSK